MHKTTYRYRYNLLFKLLFNLNTYTLNSSPKKLENGIKKIDGITLNISRIFFLPKTFFLKHIDCLLAGNRIHEVFFFIKLETLSKFENKRKHLSKWKNSSSELDKPIEDCSV